MNDPSNDNKSILPVFVFPSSLNFYADDSTSLKQILTLYNPYEFLVNYRVLCTAPKKYTVNNREGSIKPKNCIDIIVRLNDTSTTNYNKTDQFRICLFVQNNQQNLVPRKSSVDITAGKRDISSTFWSTKVQNIELNDNNFEPTTSSLSSSTLKLDSSSEKLNFQNQNLSFRFGENNNNNNNNNNFRNNNFNSSNPVIIATALVCLVTLGLPSHEDESSYLPIWLHLSPNYKLVAAYILGMVTMTIFKT